MIRIIHLNIKVNKQLPNMQIHYIYNKKCIQYLQWLMTQTVGKKKSIDFFIDCTADDKQNIVQAGQDQIWQQSSHLSHHTNNFRFWARWKFPEKHYKVAIFLE